MGRERERTFIVQGKEIKESEIPQVFNLSHLLEDFKKAVDLLGKEKAIEKFVPLLRKQLLTLIQEQVILPLSPRFLYEVEQKEEGGIQVLDPDYPSQPDIVERAKEGWLFAAGKGKHGEQSGARYAEVFVQRYLLEFLQTQKLVNEHLAQDPLLSLPLLQKLATSAESVQISDRKGNLQEGFTSPWYALAMPRSEAHAGGGSYFNVYRLVAFPQSNSDEVKYVVESQGYYHRIGWRAQAHKLLNIDQVDTFHLDQFDEEATMMRIIQLSEDKNNLGPEELLVKLGVQAGDWLLPRRIRRARKRQDQQAKSIDSSIHAILEIFQREFTHAPSITQDTNLKIFFEALANPLLLNKNVPGEEVVKKFDEVLVKTGDRVAFLGSLANVIPTIFTRVGGWGICGALSAGGGLVKNGANGFGGLHPGLGIDTCQVCPNCQHLSTNSNRCTHCSYKRGQPLSAISDKRINYSQTSHSPKISNQTKSEVSFLPSFQILSRGNTTKIDSLWQMGPTNPVSGQSVFQLRAVA